MSPTLARLIAASAGALGVLLVGAGIGLWAKYGGAVFFERLAAGIAGCFG